MEPSEGVKPCYHLNFTLGDLQNCEKGTFLFFKPLNLWYIVMTALRCLTGSGKRANDKECGL